jgi:N-acetylglucosaminyldiphosphoundecaprenol N-acetyl-beta-D-mannosaminyltransferase
MNITHKLNTFKRNLLGLPVHDIKRSILFSLVEEAISTKQKLIIFGIAAGTYGELNWHPEFIYFFNNMDIILPEGGGIPLIGKLFDVPISEHLAIVDISNELIKIAAEKSYKIMLFGANQQVNDQANEKIKLLYPTLILAKGINGYFEKSDEITIVERINDEMPDILFIGIRSPIKEEFALKYKNKLNVKIIIPCGGYFDVLAGLVKRPKYTFKWFPTTWLFRFLSEPKRLYKQTILPIMKFVFFIFPILLFKHKLGISKNPSIIKFYKLENYKYSIGNE